MVASGGTIDRAQRALRLAADAQKAGRTAEAQRHYRDVLTIDAQNVVALNGLGMVALRSGDCGAATWFRRAIQADANSTVLWLNLASAFRLSRDDDGEEEALRQALSIDRQNVMANLRLAELLDRGGREKEAFEYWGGLVTMLSLLPDGGPDVDRVLKVARERADAYRAKFAQEIDTAIADERDRMPPEQRRRFDRCVDTMVGRRRIYHHQPHGLHFPFLPEDEFFDRALFSWLPELESQAPAILADLQGLLSSADADFAPYVQMAPGSPKNDWSPLDQSRRWSARHLWRYGLRDDAACARCPATVAALAAVPMANIPGQGPTVFFSILAPGTRLPPHTGVSNIRSIVHLPLIVPDGCGFRVGGETRSWKVGEAFVFDDTIEHEAWNDSDHPRAVLIFDVWNPHLQPTEIAGLRTLFTAMGNEAASIAHVSD
jgi:aspartyl/asparaginyl beta-hydroxylase (cupin superfamily)